MVTLGNLLLRDSGYAALRSRRVALLANPTAVFADTLEHLADAMHRDLRAAANASLVTVLSPEHGFRGDHQAERGDRQYVDNSTGLTVWPAYSLPIPNITDVLRREAIERVVVDMQDVGVRLYTFVWTMHKVMAAAAAAGARLVVLDRPNPLGGEDSVVAGPLLNSSCCASGYGMEAVTHQHGLTIGELATLFAARLNCTVDVVRMRGWRRSMRWRDTGLPWILPSPNLPTPTSVDAYPATVFLEATTVAEGRGTSTPFTLFGAPWLDAHALVRRLTSNGTAAPFRAAWFTPVWSKYNGTDCEGAAWVRDVRGGFAAGVEILSAVRALAPPGRFRWDGSWFGHPGSILVDEYAGTPRLRELLEAGTPWQQVVAEFAADEAAFRDARRPFLLYR